MESRQNPQSIMARLMGLDDLPHPNGSAQKPQQVISQTYLQRLASVGVVGKKRLYRERRHSVAKSLEKPKPDLGSIEIQGSPNRKSFISRDLHDLRGDNLGNTAALPRASVCRNVDVFRRKPESGDHGNLLGHSSYQRSGVESKKSSERYFSSASNSHSGVERNERNTVGCDVKSVGLSPASREFLEELSRRTRRRVTKGSSLGFRVGDAYAIKPELSRPLGIEAEKQLAGRCPRARGFEEAGPAPAVSAPGVSRPRNHLLGYGRRGHKDIDRRRLSKPQAKYEAFRSKWSLKSGKPLNWARINLRKPEPTENGSEDETKNMVDPSRSVYSVSAVADMAMDSRTEVSVNRYEKDENERLESRSSILLEEDDDCSSRATDGSVQQEASIGFGEEHSAFSGCSRMELDSLVIVEETFQPSPISVLEPPFSEEAAINGIEFLGSVKADIYDLGLQLELLRSEMSETYSEGPGMAVSSDDECEEGLAREPAGENEAYMKICGAEDGKNLLNLVEAAIAKAKNLGDFSTWDSLVTPISVSVFETLEKKCCDRVSWKRSERRLLFDRVNAGLAEILSPRIGVPTWENSVSRRFSAARGKEMMEENLWKLLASQEKKCGSEENVLGSEFGKIELGDETGEIGQEIERLLFDELLAEFLC